MTILGFAIYILFCLLVAWLLKSSKISFFALFASCIVFTPLLVGFLGLIISNKENQ